MEQVVLKGVTYTKAATAAKKFGYTSDYIGQLCRKKKIRCELVGRSWFVDEESVAKHKRGRYQQKSDEKSSEEATTEVKIRTIEKSREKEKISNDNVKLKHDDRKYRVKINPHQSKSVIKRELQPSKFSQHITWTKAIYRPDQDDLLPPLVKKENPEKDAIKLNVDPAEAKKVRIQGQEEEVSLEPTELPSVSLTGTLRIKSFDPDSEEESTVDNKPKNKATMQSPRQLQNTKGVIAVKRQAAPISFTPQSVQARQIHFQARLERALHEEPAQADHDPERVGELNEEAEAPHMTTETEENTSLWRFLPSPAVSILLGLLFALVVASVLLSLEGLTVANSDMLEYGTTFNAGALGELFGN